VGNSLTKEEQSEMDTISALWDIKDVQSQHPELTDTQAAEVLSTAIAQHDPSIGISWEVLGEVAEELFGGEK